jgi:hypothetical protein
MIIDLRDELVTQLKDGKYVPEYLKIKMGILYETREMNPPFFFSWEFTAGTYAPILFPFFFSLL